jgi:hypothetical protein
VSSEFFGRRQRVGPVSEPETVAHAVVVHRQHIRPTELEHQHHLHRPGPDAAHLREPRDDRCVVERGERCAAWYHARERMHREIFECGSFRGGEPDRAEHRRRCVTHLLGCREGAPRVQRDEAHEDRVSGTTADLLRGDRPYEVTEGRCARLGA